MSDNQLISFNNGIASVKEGQTVDEQALRNTQVYAKLMLSKGNKFNAKTKSMDQFILSESKEYISAEMFILGSRGQMIVVDKVFLNINPTQSSIKPFNNSWVCELIHPSFDVDEFNNTKAVTFK